MKYYTFIVLFIYSLFFLPGCGSETANKSKTDKPNILVLISDDQRWDQVSYIDNPIIPELQTANLDKLAGEGVYFTNAFITTPICAVSRASIMTGRYARTHGMNSFNTPIPPEALNTSYPALLHQAGYRTGVLGKWGMGTEGTENIFDVFNAWHNQGSYFHEVNGEKMHNSEWLAMKTREFLEEQDPDKPFCLTVCFKSPHHPYQPDVRDTNLFREVNIPKRETDTKEEYQKMASHVMEGSLNRWCYFDERKDEPTKEDFEKNFLRCVMSLDRAIGQIMNTLEELNLEDNTAILFLSDNGYMWGEHGLGGKWLLYEESIHVPMIIKLPGVKQKSKVKKSDVLALNIDVAPTILDLAGIEAPEDMNGISLIPFLQNEKLKGRSDFFMEHVDIVEVHNPIPDSEGIRTPKWKFIRYLNAEPEVVEVYNIEDDPMETRNLANDPEYSKIKNELEQKYQGYLDKLSSN